MTSNTRMTTAEIKNLIQGYSRTPQQKKERSLVHILDMLASSNSNYTEVTFEELKSLVETSSLKRGEVYLITDYQTTYKIQYTDSNGDGTGGDEEIGIGEVEPLLVKANSENTFELEVYSTIHPTDVIRWRYFKEGDEEDSAVYDQDISNPNYKGTITYRESSNYNKCNFDFRQVKRRRWLKVYQPTVELNVLEEGTVAKNRVYQFNCPIGLRGGATFDIKYKGDTIPVTIVSYSQDNHQETIFENQIIQTIKEYRTDNPGCDSEELEFDHVSSYITTVELPFSLFPFSDITIDNIVIPELPIYDVVKKVDADDENEYQDYLSFEEGLDSVVLYNDFTLVNPLFQFLEIPYFSLNFVFTKTIVMNNQVSLMNETWHGVNEFICVYLNNKGSFLASCRELKAIELFLMLSNNIDGANNSSLSCSNTLNQIGSLSESKIKYIMDGNNCRILSKVETNELLSNDFIEATNIKASIIAKNIVDNLKTVNCFGDFFGNIGGDSKNIFAKSFMNNTTNVVNYCRTTPVNESTYFGYIVWGNNITTMIVGDESLEEYYVGDIKYCNGNLLHVRGIGELSNLKNVSLYSVVNQGNILNHNFIDRIENRTLTPTSDISNGAIPTKSVYDKGLSEHVEEILTSGVVTYSAAITS